MTNHEPTDGRLRFDHVPPDAPEALALMHALVSDLLARYGADDWQGDVVPEGCTAPSGAFVVVRAEGRPVACGGLRALAPGVAELKRMYVSPAVRGRGVARALLAHLEEEARARGYRTMRLEAGTRQPEALRLYEAAGYRPVTPGWGEYADDPQSAFFEKSLVATPP